MNKNSKLIIILISITVTLSSCYNYKSLQLLQENKLLPTYEQTKFVDYRIRVNDELIYRIITSSDDPMVDLLSSNSGGVVGGAGRSASGGSQVGYRVFTDGTIDLPFIDSIHVEGLTLNEGGKKIEKHIRKFIPDAIIKLAINNKTFTIFGDAGTGVVPINKDKMTIFQALAASGDLNEQSDRKHVRIIRETNEGTVILNFDIRPKSIIESKYYYVYPNDIIYVQREFSSFYKTTSYSSVLGLITFSATLLFNVLVYTK